MPDSLFLCFFLQKRRGQCNSKRISEKYNPEEEGSYGFPLEPAKAVAHNTLSHSGQLMHPGAYGSSCNMNLKEEIVLAAPDRVFTSKNSKLRKQNSSWQGSTAQLSRFSNSVAVRGDSQLDMSKDCSLNSQWQEDHFDLRYSHLTDGESNQMLDETKYLRKKDFHLLGKDRAMVKKLLVNTFNLCNCSIILESHCMPLSDIMEDDEFDRC